MTTASPLPTTPAPPFIVDGNDKQTRDLTYRFNVYRSKKAKSHLCVCAARDAAHAVRIARCIWYLDRSAHAIGTR